MRTETLIFSQLMNSEEYTRRVMPHLHDEYFQTAEDKNFFKIYSRFFKKHNQIPSRQAMMVEIENLKGSADIHKALSSVIKETETFNENTDYLVETTEKFCKERALFNALRESVLIVDASESDKPGKKSPEAIPSILQAALSICFDTTVGHDYEEDASARHDYYHLTTARIPVGISEFDYVTKGGFPRKTLNVLLAPPHGGKSAVMVNFGAGALRAGYNVLYITLEMAEFEIGKRFDVNMMGVDFDMLESLPKETYINKFSSVMKKSQGTLKVKEFPTGAGHAGHFRSLLEELKTKQNWVPDMVIVDYMGICASEKYKASSGANSYTLQKSVGEELRALAIEYNCAVITAVQTNRSGVGNSDVDMTSTSESLGTPMIADWFCAIINTDELKNLKQILFKQLKNRYRSLDDPNKFIVGIDYSQMRMFSLEDNVPKFKKKDKPLNKPAEGNFDLDMLHTIKPKTANFDDFNFDS